MTISSFVWEPSQNLIHMSYRILWNSGALSHSWQLGWAVYNLRLIKGLFKVQTPIRVHSPTYFSLPRMASGHRGCFLSPVVLEQTSASRANSSVAGSSDGLWTLALVLLLWPLTCLCWVGWSKMKTKFLNGWRVADGIIHWDIRCMRRNCLRGWKVLELRLTDKWLVVRGKLKIGARAWLSVWCRWGLLFSTCPRVSP